MRCAALAFLAVIACGDPTVVVSPIVDAPAPGSDADPFDGAAQFTLSIATAGSDVDLAFVSAGPGQTLSLVDVPFGDDLVFHLSAQLMSGVEVAYGRSCPVNVPLVDQDPPHLYFSRIVKWGTSAVPAQPTRTGGSAFAGGSGLAAFAGGRFMDRVEVFDARAGAFRTLDGEVQTRVGAVLADFGDGRAALIGGEDEPGNTKLTTIDVIDLRDDDAVVETSPGVALVGHAAATLVDGSVLVAGGIDTTSPEPTGLAYSIEFGAGDVLAPAISLAPLNVAREGHSMTRLTDDLSSDVLVVGGRGAGDMVTAIELYRPLREKFELVDTGVRPLVVPRAQHVAVRLPDGSVLVLGGVDRDGTPVQNFEVYDPRQAEFGEMPTLLADGVGLTEVGVTPLPDGRVLLSGGRNASGEPVASVFIAQLDEFDGRVNVFPTDSMDAPRAGHAATLLCDGTVLIVGGNQDAIAAERYNPPSPNRR